jgi:DNA-binding transcriptional LysR family regulator
LFDHAKRAAIAICVLRTNDLENQMAAARGGVGLAALPHFLGDADARLQRHIAAPGAVGRDIWLLVHRDLRRAPAIRAVMEFLTECVKPG